MSIDFSNEQEQTFDFDFLKVAEDVMETVLDQEGCPYESQICLVRRMCSGVVPQQPPTIRAPISTISSSVFAK